ncbi:hypothetical protein RJ639_014370 [Escallonia herrerae]|uniref:TraB domain-containing protein n=1 Tax=Escallonia herrerae TaxID=1293975 RepID=A0AA88VHL2_9ASTE|nr:hypothetical protein RJ639_014370 [Escallonia herrerae]
MHRVTRALTLVNSPDSRHLITSPLRRDPSPKFLAAATVTAKNTTHTPRRYLPTSQNPNHHHHSSSLHRPFTTVMDSELPVPPESPSHAAEDSVHVDYDNFNYNINRSDGEVSDPSVAAGDGRGFDVASTNGEAEDGQRKVLPAELSRSVMVLTCESAAEGGSCDVYLVGTAHVSMESCQEVQAVIGFLKPQVAVNASTTLNVEFQYLPGQQLLAASEAKVDIGILNMSRAILASENRYSILENIRWQLPIKVPTLREMVVMLKKNNNLFGVLYSWFLARMANKLEVFPGAEFRVAFEEAMKYGGKVILGDRPVTLRRTWGKMPLWHKTKLVYSLLFQSIFLPSPAEVNKMLKEMDDADMLTLVIQELSKKFPTLMETLVHERDMYMSTTLLKVASEHSSVVAVVGKGHLQGIKKHWKQPVELMDLLDIPSNKPIFSVAKILKTLGVAVAGVAIVSGICRSRRN